jgi:hypothetical protein
LASIANAFIDTAIARMIGDCYPNADVDIMPGCEQFPWRDDPDRFRASVIRFSPD